MSSDDVQAAIDALVYRFREWIDAEPEDRADVEPFAAEFIHALRAHGWRPTQARRPQGWRANPADRADTDTVRRRAAQIRNTLADRVETERLTGTPRPPREE